MDGVLPLAIGFIYVALIMISNWTLFLSNKYLDKSSGVDGASAAPKAIPKPYISHCELHFAPFLP